MLARTMKMSLVALGLAMGTGLAAPAFAETLAVDGQLAIKPTGVTIPQRGLSMAAVEQQFGAPANKSGPVGNSAKNPPITKWFYPNFVVVFENDKVIHAVAVGG
jgi:hypothetical protein